MRLAATSLVAPAALLLLSGCFVDVSDFEHDRFREDFKSTHALAPGGTLTVIGFNGKIEILTWDRNEVEIAGTKYASTESRLKDLKVEIRTPGNAVDVRAIQNDSFRKGGISFSLRVPKNCVLDRIETTNGAIRVEGVNGSRINLVTRNGAVDVLDTTGELTVETSNGSIEVPSHNGDARLKSSNGRIRADLADGSADVKTSNGKIELQLGGKSTDKTSRVETSNGSIELDLDNARPLNVRTSNSAIRLTLPRNANAEVRAETSHSSVSSDFDSLTKEKHSAYGKIGSGGPMIELRTSNGSISLRSR